MNSLIDDNVSINPVIEQSWFNVLKDEFSKDYFISLKKRILEDKKQGFTIYPKGKDIFNAYNLTPFEEVKVIILGQDPYHGAGQAHGLSFSVPNGIPFPPSLRNIFKEMSDDVGVFNTTSGDLTPYANQGVFLLNSFLTVRANEPASHQKFGWETFTDATIKALSDYKSNLVFILWGSFAISKSALIDESKHLIIKSVHPSPLSSHRGFFGSKPFSKTNDYLIKNGIQPIEWGIA